MRTRPVLWFVAMLLLLPRLALSSEFGSKGGPEPANLQQIASRLREDPYDLELLISFGTSKGGSAGHIALALRDDAAGEERVYSANFYADRDPAHASGRYTTDLMVAIPKQEYLFKTVSTVAETASFGLDFGEIYKRSVIGVRVYGVPAADKAALAAYFRRINDDYHQQRSNTEYHHGPIRYDYLRLNCAKTIGAAFKYGAGYRDLAVTGATLFSGQRMIAAATANIPTEMAMKLVREWGQRNYGMDVVLYKKYRGSAYVDPQEEEKIAFKDLPDRFPSVLSLDFRREAGAYQDYDNLLAMYLLFNLGKYSVRVNEQTLLLEIEKSKDPMPYAEALQAAERDARADSEKFQRHIEFRPSGEGIGEAPDNTHLYHFNEEAERKVAR
ncbi:hypothetical protein CBM2637_B130015 [Cupriavidus taiwanensis]|uniref:hypothetical protein n=1 Tax=Cupriavidus taiwanensis TaxID=164546 RepID=UPI000E14FB87|nr:hypothetical protein [Cupriavidus taiwanensis]SPA32626.1 hypothetical protein CBM2637_B130015 [Cupriavidus taiwanensis]